MTDLGKCAEQVVNASQSTWSALVDIALGLTPKQLDRGAKRLAKLAGVEAKTILQKFKAIRLAANENSPADIKLAGQAKTLSTYVKAKNGARTDKQVVLSWRVAPTLRDDVHAEILRIGNVLGVHTSNEFWEWMLAEMSSWSEAELLHSAQDRMHKKCTWGAR